jgi:hypothetical protein
MQCSTVRLLDCTVWTGVAPFGPNKKSAAMNAAHIAGGIKEGIRIQTCNGRASRPWRDTIRRQPLLAPIIFFAWFHLTSVLTSSTLPRRSCSGCVEFAWFRPGRNATVGSSIAATVILSLKAAGAAAAMTTPALQLLGAGLLTSLLHRVLGVRQALVRPVRDHLVEADGEPEAVSVWIALDIGTQLRQRDPSPIIGLITV